MIRLRCAVVPALALLAACGNTDPVDSDAYDAGRSDTPTGDVKLDASTSAVADARAPRRDASTPIGENPACKNLQCDIETCASGVTTTVSGKVYDPAGKNPLYNVAVFIPNSKPKDFKFGATCDACDDLYTGDPITAALTDANGEFKLENVPTGSNIPIVVQVGKWRRQTTIASVTSCQDNKQPDRSLRLPKNASEGDIPKIAISTGGADTLECLLRRIGLDPAEYVPGDSDAGRIHIFHGTSRGNNEPAPNTSPAAPESAQALWNSTDKLNDYDIVMLSCEGDEVTNMNQQALHDYASAGGRVFASHFHYSWFNSGPYGSENLATWSKGSNDIGDIDANIVTTLADGTQFVKGQALSDWLGNNGALKNGKLHIEAARHNADVSASNTPSQPWITADQSSKNPGATQYFSFNTPTDALQMIGDNAPMYCGRVVFSDLHVGAASGDDKRQPVPNGCTDRDLSPQEKALEFMLFDLSSCITPDKLPPPPPPPVL
jgi:hypothetical protein